MFGEERRSQILDRLSRQGSVSVTALSRSLGCSEATLRRDLEAMARAGLVRRTHGGALLPEMDHTQRELRPRDKATLCAVEKRAIGLAAARLVEPGDVVAFNGGTTTVQVARALRSAARLRVVTNSIGVATELAGQPSVEVTLTGGMVRGSLELCGPLAEQSLRDFYVHIAFIGVDGLTARHGLTTYNQMEAHANRAIITRAERVVVVADHTKIGRVTMALIAPAQDIQTVITDAAAPPDELAALQEAGVEILIAS
jgi:DeoR family transcriptional regulator, aga operon transcriptional repressor